MDNDSELISLDAGEIKRRIFTIRGRQVMTDSALAEYFGTTTGNLNRAMKRNIKRFPESFCFQLTDDLKVAEHIYPMFTQSKVLPC